MTTASLKLCQELYELSGWEATDFAWWANDREKLDDWSIDKIVHVETQTYKNLGWKFPAYDLGYLLRKLPPIVTLKSRSGGRWSAQLVRGQLVYSYQEQKDEIKKWEIERTADTPEDALTLLAIELFKQGVIKL